MRHPIARLLIAIHVTLCVLCLAVYFMNYEGFQSLAHPDLSVSVASISESDADPRSTFIPPPPPPPTSTDSGQSLKYCPIEYHNAQSLSHQELDRVLKLRTTAPTTICNPDDAVHRRTEWDRLNTDRLPPNLMPFANRCAMHILSENAEFTELWTNNETTYNHVYKCGGTTIWNALDRLQKGELMNGRGIKYKLHRDDSFLLRDNDYYWDHHRYFNDYFRRNFMFSFVRDPVDRSLSSYYELAVKDTKVLRANQGQEVEGKYPLCFCQIQRRLVRC